MSTYHKKMLTCATIDEQVSIMPDELHQKLDTIILNKLKQKLEGYCTQYGYVESVLSIEEKEQHPKLNDNGTGDCVVLVKVKINRILPEKGQLIECKITADDEHMGVFISYDNPVFISIINNTADEIHVDDVVVIQIEDFQLKHRDTIINITSTYVKKKELKE